MFGSVCQRWDKAEISALCHFLQSSLGFWERQVVTLDRQSSDISLQAFKGKGLPVASAVSRLFSLPVKCKPKAVLAEIRTLRSDISVLRSSVETLLLG